MREILFKAKRIDNNEWVSGGSLVTFSDNGVKSFFMPQFNEKCICEHDRITDDILSFSNCRFYKVHPETLCQFTGLHDKNGNKIWENDICVYDDMDICVVRFGEYDNNTGHKHIGFHTSWQKYKDLYREDLGFWASEEREVEVISNIFTIQSY